MTRFFVFLFLAFFAIHVQSFNAYAQDFNFDEDEETTEPPKVLNPYDEKYRPMAFVEESAGDAGDLMPESFYDISFRREEGTEGVINMLLTLPASVSGCIQVQGGEIKMNMIADRLELDISNPELNLNRGGNDYRGERHYAHHQCGVKSQASSLEMPLTRDMLLQNGIKRIKIRRSGSDLKDILIDNQQHFISFLSVKPGQDMESLSRQERLEEMKYWFYPENTLVLNAKNIKNDKVAKNVRALARYRGLTPIEEFLPGFEPSPRNKHNIYVVDMGKQYVNKLATTEDSLTLGTINTTEQYFSANGPYDKTIKTPVSARIPGSSE